jgi:hypothetical protein
MLAKMKSKEFILVVSIYLLVLSGALFYSAYQLRIRYDEALDWFRRNSPHFPVIVLPTPPYNYVFYVASYENFFAPHVIEGTVSLIIALTLIIYLIQKLNENVAFAIIIIVLVVGSIHSLFQAYQIWNRYREATQTFSKSISVPNAFYIEDFQNFFFPYVTAGVVSLVIAITLFYVSFHRRYVAQPLDS